MRPIIFALFWAIVMPASLNATQYNLVDQELINRLNPQHFHMDFSGYDQQTAGFCAELSDAAYLAGGDYPYLERRLNEAYGAGRFSIRAVEVAQTHTRALICATDRFVVVAFRGTEFSVLKDVVSDLKYKRYINSEGADEYVRDLPAGHAGFRKGSIMLLREQNLFGVLAGMIRERSGTTDPTAIPVYLTGHSMGAGYASLFVQPVARTFKFGGAYNFAPPLTVSCSHAQQIKSTYGPLIYDVVNYKDYIARAGAYCRNYMAHVGQFYRISDGGVIHEEDEHYIAWTYDEWGFRNLLHYHRLAGYKEAIADRRNSNEAIRQRRLRGDVLFSNADYGTLKCSD